MTRKVPDDMKSVAGIHGKLNIVAIVGFERSQKGQLRTSRSRVDTEYQNRGASIIAEFEGLRHDDI